MCLCQFNGVSGATGVNTGAQYNISYLIFLITSLMTFLLSIWAGELTGKKNLGEEWGKPRKERGEEAG